jgi:uncharacterized flavoprotein (TIGR03862 family)
LRKKTSALMAQNWHVAAMSDTLKHIAIIGAGPAGLIAAEILAPHAQVTIYDRMPSPGRKLLMAGRGGLNLTHSETAERFLARYPAPAPALAMAIGDYPPEALIAWANGLGQDTFIGSSGRVFPRAMKASPLLRAWLARLGSLGVELHTRHDWKGWTEGGLAFDTPDGATTVTPDATLLALGGASWPRLGSNGHWTAYFGADAIAPLVPANMGFTVAWSEFFRGRHAGTPLKRIGLTFGARTTMGEAMITTTGIEGGAIYTLSSPIRDAIAADGHATVMLDLRPDLLLEDLTMRLPEGRGSQSMSNFLRSKAGLSPVAIGLVQEALHAGDTRALAEIVKALPIRLDAPAPLARAISSAGGLKFAALDDGFMLRGHPGVFAAGEMLDWEAPTGGYLLQGCFSTGSAAAHGLLNWLRTPE